MDGRPQPRNDKRITTCKRCRAGIFAGQETQWQTHPVMGMVHVKCDA